LPIPIKDKILRFADKDATKFVFLGLSQNKFQLKDSEVFEKSTFKSMTKKQNYWIFIPLLDSYIIAVSA